MRKVVLDIETKNTFSDVGANDPVRLDLSLMVVYDYSTNTYQSFLEQDLPKLWRLLEDTDQIIGFNSDHFDIPILNKYYTGDLSKIKSIDLMQSIVQSFGRRLPLDAIAAGTLGKQKSGHGLQAITWWKQGEIEKLRKYCEDDVRITKEVYEYALANKSLKYKIGLDSGIIPIDTSKWEEKHEHKINYTLPF
jgi:hypothetical protein